MNFYKRFEELCRAKGQFPQSREILEMLGVTAPSVTGWKKGATPKFEVLLRVSKYFNVPIEYLTGEEDERDDEYRAKQAMDEVIDWLEANEYEVDIDEYSTYTISKDGDYEYVPEGDFLYECSAIKESAKDGFELAMRDWERKTFGSFVELNEDELFLITVFRTAGAIGRARINQLLLNITDEEEKKNKRNDTKAIR